MYRKITLIMAALFILLASACAPVVPAAPIVQQPSIPVTGMANVLDVEIQVLETQPVQAIAVIHGQLPDAGCTTVASTDQVQAGNILNVVLTTTTDPVALCTQALTPFEQTVSLNVSSLAPAVYTVNINGVEQSFYLPTRDAELFKQSLVEALNERDYGRLKAFMGTSFLAGYWLSEGGPATPEQAIELLQRSLLASSSPIAADARMNLIDLLGTDPYTMLGAEVIEASPLFTTGWGPEGKDEAILFAARRRNGEMYWHGLIFAREGFAQIGPIVPPSTPVPAQPAPGTQEIPTFSILSVVEDESVTIQTFDFPAETKFQVRMGKSGSGGVDGILVESINSRNGGSFVATFEIPEKLHGEGQIAIRLESSSGYYSYNWFDNDTFERPKNDPLPTGVEYVMAKQDLSVYSGPAKHHTILDWVDEGDILRVTGVSPDGRWWMVACPDGSSGSCWVLGRFTKPAD
ncbi:MAG TPA: hypothetical protein VFY26_18995 [Anaerolineales bacterium]|nr:hypothetical protein [Anaerolineales bacterium]